MCQTAFAAPIVILVSLAVGCRSGQPSARLGAAGPDSVVAMAEEPYHRAVLQNRRLAVYDVTLPLGAIMRFHAHPTNHLAIVIDTGRMANEILGQPPRINPTGPSGTIVYLPAGPPHRQTNIGQSVVRFIAVEMLGGQLDSAAALADRGDRRAVPDRRTGCHVALEASDVRAWRCRLPAGTTAPARRTPAPFLRIFLSDGTRGQPPGSVTWHDSGSVATSANRGRAELEFVDLEWRES